MAHIDIGINSPLQPKGVWLDIAADLRIVIAEVVVHKPGFLVKILAGKAQVVGEVCAIPIRVFVRQGRTEWIAVPPPHHCTPRVCNGARRVQMIGIDKKVRVILQHCDWHIPQVNGFLDRLALEGVFPEQVSGLVIDEVAARLPGGCPTQFGHPLAQTIDPVLCHTLRIGHPDQPPTAIVDEPVGAVAHHIANGIIGIRLRMRACDAEEPVTRRVVGVDIRPLGRHQAGAVAIGVRVIERLQGKGGLIGATGCERP